MWVTTSKGLGAWRLQKSSRMGKLTHVCLILLEQVHLLLPGDSTPESLAFEPPATL